MIALAEYNKNPFDIDSNKLTFDDVWNKWSPPHFIKHPGGAAGMRSAYKRCAPLYNLKMGDIKKAHMQAVLDDMAGMSEESQTKVKTIFKFSFKWCLENDVVQKDYSQFLTLSAPKKKEGKVKYFRPEELQLLRGSMDFTVDFPTGKKSYSNQCLTDTVEILLYTGMRIGELLDIKTANVNLDERTIYVEGTKTENAKRLVPIHKAIIGTLKQRLDQSQNGLLIENTNGKPIKYDTYKKHFFDPWMETLGIKHTPHATRHTFVSMMDSAGVPSTSVALKRIVGHANASVTEHYTHKDISELIQTIEKLNFQT